MPHVTQMSHISFGLGAAPFAQLELTWRGGGAHSSLLDSKAFGGLVRAIGPVLVCQWWDMSHTDQWVFRMPDPLVADTTDIGLGRLSHRLLNRPTGILALGVTPPMAAGEEEAAPGV